MRIKIYIRRDVLLACSIAAMAAITALGSASTALATNVCGSGATVQKSIQELWIKEYKGAGTVAYNATSSGEALADFGYTGGALTDDTKCPTSELDAYIGVDSAPNSTELGLAETAANSGGSKITGVEVPVGQVPLASLESAPTDIEVNESDELGLSNALAAELYAGTVPADGVYSANTWGALLLKTWSLVSGKELTVITSGSPTTGEFLDTGSSSAKTGGYTPITVQVRANGAGATLTLKQYLDDVDSTDWGSTTIDENTQGTNEWPSGATTAGFNTTDSKEAEVTMNTPGDVGYATVGAAILIPNPFTCLKPLDIIIAGVLHWAFIPDVQDNEGDTPFEYASPCLSESPEEANVYEGTKIGINGGSGVGNWEVPETGGKFNPLGDWTAGTKPSEYSHAWDPDVYLDAGSSNTETYYPLVIGLWDLGWSEYDAGNIAGLLTEPTQTGEDVSDYLEYVTGKAGQEAELSKSEYFAPLPTAGSGTANIDKDAQEAAVAVDKL
ncbi:MAG TPA: hypothetical protein VGP18_10095 [Solirubrobacteraceae bacterium]|jgi:hypothetical protein|nr:hypothetical protein [Solirubrobacteraceae bacterium]